MPRGVIFRLFVVRMSRSVCSSSSNWRMCVLMVGWEIKPGAILNEVHSGEHSKFFDIFYRVCITFIVPIVMAFVLAGQMIDFFSTAANSAVVVPACYIIAAVLLVVFWVVAFVGGRKKETVQ